MKIANGQRRTLKFIVIATITIVSFQNCGQFERNSAVPTPTSVLNAETITGATTPNATNPSPSTTSTPSNGDSIAITLSPNGPAAQPGGSITFTAAAIDAQGNQLDYSWSLNGRIVGGNSSTYILTNIKKTTNNQVVSVTATARGSEASAAATTTIHIAQYSCANDPVSFEFSDGDWMTVPNTPTLQDCKNFLAINGPSGVTFEYFAKTQTCQYAVFKSIPTAFNPAPEDETSGVCF